MITIPDIQKRRLLWSVTDQGVASLSNFLLLIVVIRSGDLEEVGAFGIVYTSYFLVMAVVRGLSSEPLTVRYSGSSITEFDRAVAASTGATLAVSCVIGVLGASAGLLVQGALGHLILVVSVLLPGLLLQDAWRMSFFCAGRPVAALVNDGVLFVVQGLLYVAIALLTWESISLFILGWGVAGACSALLGMRQAKVLPSPRGALGWAKQTRDLGLPFAGDQLANRGFEQLAMVAIGAMGGLAAMGAITTVRSLFAPLTTVQTGINSYALPEIARRHGDREFGRLRRLVRSIALGMVMLMLVGGVALALVPAQVGEAAIGPNWAVAGSLLVAMTVFSLLNAVAHVYWLALRGMQKARFVLYTRVLIGAFGVCSSAVGALVGGAQGAVYGMCAAALAMAVCLIAGYEATLGGSRTTPRGRTVTQG